MQPKPDGLIFINAKTQTVAFRFGGKVFVTKSSAWKYFITKHCVEITSIPGGGRISHSGDERISSGGGHDPTDPANKKWMEDLFRDI